MAKIRIKNFGPIKEGLLTDNGWIEINKVTLFIGNQGSGKSTIAKLISTFSWMEKVLERGDYPEDYFSTSNRIRSFFSYHRLENYIKKVDFNSTTEMDYIGEAYSIRFFDGNFEIQKNTGSKYFLPQIMYVPAERNFISYVKSSKELKLSSDSLKEFLAEFDNAKKTIKDHLLLPVNQVKLIYEKTNDQLKVRGEDYILNLTEASSGFQSIVPLFLVSWYLSNRIKKHSEVEKEGMSVEESDRFKKMASAIFTNDDLSEEQKRLALSALSSRFNKSAFINIVEEPEQNLFPSSQWDILAKLLEFNNMNEANKLIMTTHSPYILSFLSIAIQAMILSRQIKSDDLWEKLNKEIPTESMVRPEDVSIYQLNEGTGIIQKLANYEGIPSDNNYLNQYIDKANQLFDSLLEIEEQL